jgi:inner membrane protein
MDNVCHTLVGAALAKTGLERRSALGGATLMIGANFPDIDVLAVPLGMSFEWRRGVTHGVLALVVLPVVLTGIMLAWDRFVRRRGGRDRPAADPRALLLLSAISILSHPVLDWMNVYGVRWLMPFDGTWFYGDALFIVDPWIWGALAVGVVAARRRWRRGDSPSAARQPATWALGLVSAYIVAMFVLGIVAESRARRAFADAGVGQADRIMAAPVPVNPLRRQIVASLNDGAEYRFADLRWTPATTFELQDFTLESGLGSPIADRARATDRGAGFLQWARFPFVTLEGLGPDASVWIGDARYSVDARVSWAAVRIDLPPDALPIRE